MSFVDEIAARLVAQNVGVLTVSIGISSAAIVPEDIGRGGPESFLTIIEHGGTGSVKTHNNVSVQRPSAQLKARALTYQAARDQIKLAYDALGGADGLFNITLSGTFYQSITARQEPTDTGPDEAGLPTVSFNIDAEKRPS